MVVGSKINPNTGQQSSTFTHKDGTPNHIILNPPHASKSILFYYEFN